MNTSLATELPGPSPAEAEAPEYLPVEEPPLLEPEDWSVQDRTLAFKPELQAIQEAYDVCVDYLAQGNLLSAQESIDTADLMVAEVLADSSLAASGLARLYLNSLQTRLDRLQEILDEESLMQFAAPLEVDNDSLIALWYGDQPEEPARPLEIVHNDRVQTWIDYFTGQSRERFQLWVNRGEAYRPIIEEALKRHDLPLELYYLAMIESGFHPTARSGAGAVGIWQFIRGTGRRHGLSIDYWVDERCDVVRSTDAACQYLSHLYGIFQDWNLAMAGYNSGEFRVQLAVRRAGSRNFWDLKLPRQTQDYVPEMMAAAWIGSHLADYGFTFEPYPPMQFDELKVDKAVDLSLIAKNGDFRRDDLEALNPHLLRWCTPPDRPGYTIYVPPGKADSLTVALAKLSRDESVSFAKHRVRQGETLFEIARGYGISVDALMQRNSIRNARQLRAGSSLVIPTHPDREYQPPAPNGVGASAEKVLPPVNVPSGYSKGFYTVRKGDNLSLIAERLGVSVRRLQEWNSMGRSTRIYMNQVLQYLHVPGEVKAAQAAATEKKEQDHRRVHVVRPGESLSSISRAYGTTVQALLDWNHHLRQNSILHPGDKLVLFLGG